MEGFPVAVFAVGAALRGWWRYLVRTPRPTTRTRLLCGGAMAGAGVVGVLVTGPEVAPLVFPLVAGGVAIVVMKVKTCSHCGNVLVAVRSLFTPARYCRWCGGPIDPR